jgi:polar amino acid transport system substrate-binding protein
MDWNESELENDDLKNYKMKAEFYIRQNQDNAVIAKLKTNKPLTSADVKALEEILWSELGTKQDYENEYGSKPLGEFVREIVGLDIEFAKYIADKIGVKLEIVPLEFTAVQAGVAEGKYDLAISALAYSPTRAEAMNLSNVYLASDTGYGFLVRAEDKDKYTTLESLENAVIITQSGSVQEGLYKDNVKKCKEFKLVSSMTDGYLAVSEGKADVCITAIASGDLYAEANPGLATTSFRFDIDPNQNGEVAAAPPEGTDSLIEVVNQCIKELNDKGQIMAWYDEYTAYAAKLGIE